MTADYEVGDLVRRVIKDHPTYLVQAIVGDRAWVTHMDSQYGAMGDYLDSVDQFVKVPDEVKLAKDDQVKVRLSDGEIPESYKRYYTQEFLEKVNQPVNITTDIPQDTGKLWDAKVTVEVHGSIRVSGNTIEEAIRKVWRGEDSVDLTYMEITDITEIKEVTEPG